MTKSLPKVPAPLGRQALLEQLGDKDRHTFERQLTVYETKLGSEHADRWMRLVGVLMALAPQRPKIAAGPVMQFYVPDGPYRMQVFALHGMGDGTVEVYAPNVLDKAQAAGVLGKQAEADDRYRLPKSALTLQIEQFDGKTPNPDPVYKDMTGWNRKAMRITLPPSVTEEQIVTAERLCALAAAGWPAAPPVGNVTPAR